MFVKLFCLYLLLQIKFIQLNAEIDDFCLGCLCDSLTGCVKSEEKICKQDVCGIFRITEPYWKDAGKPGGDYRTCVTNTDCSATAVKNYMNRFEQDCNNDGKVDCFDYSSIHINGGYGCNAPLKDEVIQSLQDCLNSKK